MCQPSIYIEPTLPFLSDLFYLLTLGAEVMVALDHTHCHTLLWTMDRPYAETSA